MDIKIDSRGQKYIDVGNMRITYVEKTWDGYPGLRFQAYREQNSGSLHPGAEIPLSNVAEAYNLVAAVIRLFDEGHQTEYWFCDKCKQAVPASRVTYEETHEGCGGKCVWVK